jgi:syntaxin 16
MTLKLRIADKNVKELDRIHLKSLKEESVKENMKMNLAEKLRDFSREFRTNEETYMKTFQELVGNHEVFQLDDTDASSTKSNSNGGYLHPHHSHSGNSLKRYQSGGKDDFLQVQEHADDFLKKRDDEISTLLNSITQLGSIFKDMQTLVQHQGTILDRIDHNIDSAVDNVKSGHKHLVSTEKMMKSNCYRNCMLVVIIAIFVLGLLLMLKFSK